MVDKRYEVGTSRPRAAPAPARASRPGRAAPRGLSAASGRARARYVPCPRRGGTREAVGEPRSTVGSAALTAARPPAQAGARRSSRACPDARRARYALLHAAPIGPGAADRPRPSMARRWEPPLLGQQHRATRLLTSRSTARPSRRRRRSRRSTRRARCLGGVRASVRRHRHRPRHRRTRAGALYPRPRPPPSPLPRRGESLTAPRSHPRTRPPTTVMLRPRGCAPVRAHCTVQWLLPDGAGGCSGEGEGSFHTV